MSNSDDVEGFYGLSRESRMKLYTMRISKQKYSVSSTHLTSDIYYDINWDFSHVRVFAELKDLLQA